MLTQDSGEKVLNDAISLKNVNNRHIYYAIKKVTNAYKSNVSTAME